MISCAACPELLREPRSVRRFTRFTPLAPSFEGSFEGSSRGASKGLCSSHLCHPATRSFSSFQHKLPPSSKTPLSPVFATDPQNRPASPLLATLPKSPF